MANVAGAADKLYSLVSTPMRNLLCLLIIAGLIIPFSASAGGAPRIWGQSRHFHVTLANDAEFSTATIEIRIASSEASSEEYDKLVTLIPFRNECSATKTEIKCSPNGKTILAGAVYRLTDDGSPHCYGAKSEYRYTCIKGCKKDLPKYFKIEPYEC